MRKSFSEEELYAAAEEAQEYLLSLLPSEDSCPPHEFSRVFTAKVEEIYKQLRACTLPHKRAALGWPYYVRRTAAVVFLCFVLTCVAMPEAVMAGYQRLVEIVETIFEDYTEFRYRPEAVEKTEFIPLRLRYLPEGMEEVERDETIISLDLICRDKEKRYFEIDQKLIEKIDKTTHVIDMGNTSTELDYEKGKNIKFIYQEKYGESRIRVVWLYEQYRIIIQSNLSEEEIVKIINHIEF